MGWIWRIGHSAQGQRIEQQSTIANSQALLAEYTSLKAEQTAGIGFRDNLLYVTLAMVGALCAWALGNPAYRMHGNVWEWCQDIRGLPDRLGTGPDGFGFRRGAGLRGGSWGTTGRAQAGVFGQASWSG